MGKIVHLPALDGLRGLALLGVLFFHANGALPGGYLGVDLFFVLSGYLITSLLLGEHRDTGRILLGPFWARRARRLFPALLSLMPAIAIYGWFFAKPTELQGLRADALATLGYVANWRTIFSHKSYWDLFAAPSMLEHTWSLSIEEQFYVVWPLGVALLLRRWSSRSVRVVSLSLAVASMIAMVRLYDPESTSRVYLGTDTRAASILFGAALATVIAPGTNFTLKTVRRLDVVGVVAALGLAFAWWRLDGARPFLYRGGFWLTEIGDLVLIACAVSGSRSVVARALAWKPLTWLGTISYGVYLWHWPINVFLTPDRTHVHGFWLHVVHFVVTFAIAIVSYRFLERPIRAHGVPFGRPVYVVPAAVALVVLLVVRGTYARDLPKEPPPPADDGIDRSAVYDPSFGPKFHVIVLGDSTANSLGWGLRGIHKPGVTVDLKGQDGCTMLMESGCGGPLWSQQVKELEPDATLVFLGGAFLHGLGLDGGWRKACHPGWTRKFEDNVTQRLGAIQSPRGHVWAVTVPYPLGRYDDEEDRNEVDCINASIRKSAAAVQGVAVLDLAERLCPKGICQRELDGAEIRPDGVHFTIEGARDLSRWVLEQIQK